MENRLPSSHRSAEKQKATMQKRWEVRARLEQDREYVAQKRSIVDQAMSLDQDDETLRSRNPPRASRVLATNNLNGNSYYQSSA